MKKDGRSQSHLMGLGSILIVAQGDSRGVGLALIEAGINIFLMALKE